MSESSVVTRPYRPSDKPHVLAILERVYDADVRKRQELLWDWWQDWHSHAPASGLRPAVVERKGSLAGFICLNYRRFKLGSEEKEGVFVTDSISDPSERGVGLAMIRSVIKEIDILFGASVPRSNKLWTKLMGREDIEVFPARKARRVLHPGHFLAKRGWNRLARPAGWAWSAVSACLEAFAPRLRNADLVEVDRFPPETDRLCARWLADRTNAAHRDAVYLNWRFAEGPIAYRKVLLRHRGELAGLAAFRVGTMNGRRVLFLVELLAAHADLAGAYGSLIGHALAAGRRAGADDAQTLDAGCPALRRALARLGFFFRTEAMPVIGFMKGEISEACTVYQPNSWFFSVGDSDFEFTYFKQGWRDLVAAIPRTSVPASPEAVHA